MALISLPTESTDRRLVGIGMTLVTMAIFSVMDGIAKILTADYHPLEITSIRSLFTLVVLAPFVVAAKGAPLRSAKPLLQVGRGLAMSGSAVLFILGLSEMPIADATTIGFVSPLLVTALAIPLLGETVGVRRWSAVLVGFFGIVVVVRPGTGSYNPAALYPLLSAVAWALGLIMTRMMRGSDSPLTTTLYTTLAGLAATALALPFVWHAPDGRALLLMAAMGGLSAVGQTLLAAALRYAPASLVAPFSYSQILWSTLIGRFVFGTVPDATTWIGAAIIVASGLYILHRETILAPRSRS